MSTNEPPNDVAAALAAVNGDRPHRRQPETSVRDPILWTDETLAETEADYRRFSL